MNKAEEVPILKVYDHVHSLQTKSGLRFCLPLLFWYKESIVTRTTKRLDQALGRALL